MTIEDKLPSIIFPNRSGERKVVQLVVAGNPLLRFAGPNKDLNFHGEIYLSFLTDELLLDVEKIKFIEGKYGNEVPHPNGEGYMAIGMGYADVSLEDRRVVFHGSSGEYCIGINQDHINNIAKVEHEWTFEVRE